MHYFSTENQRVDRWSQSNQIPKQADQYREEHTAVQRGLDDQS